MCLKDQRSAAGAEADKAYCWLWLCVLSEQALSVAQEKLGKMFRSSPGQGTLKRCHYYFFFFFLLRSFLCTRKQDFKIIIAWNQRTFKDLELPLPQSLLSLSRWVLVSCFAQRDCPKFLAYCIPRLSWWQAQQGRSAPDQRGRGGLGNAPSSSSRGRFRARTEYLGYFHSSFTEIASVSWRSGLYTL